MRLIRLHEFGLVYRVVYYINYNRINTMDKHYNHYRPHDSLDLMTPMAYYQQLTLAA